MQTVKEKCKQFLTDNGMWPDEAEKVFEVAKSSLEVGGYKMSWDRPESEYPNVLYAAMFPTLKREALKYIDEHCPWAWYRPMFTDNPKAEIERLQAVQA